MGDGDFLYEMRRPTYRMSYDPKSLKGKGFVYVAADRGPYRYDNGDRYIERAWESSERLEFVQF